LVLSILPENQLSSSARKFRNKLQRELKLKRVRALAAQEESHRAAKILRQMQEQLKDDPESLLEIADTWNAINRPQTARELLIRLDENTDLTTEQRRKRNQLELATALDQAQTLIAEDKPQRALELLSETRRHLGSDPQLLHRMAKLYKHAGEYDQAISHYRALAELDLPFPDDMDEDEQWLHWAGNTGNGNLVDEAGHLLQAHSPMVFGGLHSGFRNATEGLSSLESYELPIEVQWPLSPGKAFAQILPVKLDAGRLDLADEYTRQRYGTGLLCQHDCVTTKQTKIEHGTTFAIGFHGLDWGADLGISPQGFPVSNLWGGIEIEGDLLQTGWQLTLSQRPITSTLLSYAGMKDAESGKVWGGVVATGLHLGLSWDHGGPYGIWSDLGIHQLHGERVADNLRLRALGGIYWRLRDREDFQVRGGINLMTWHFDKNLEEFTFGHGGYYSPQSYVSVSLPFSYYGHKNRWSWEVRTSVSYSYSDIEPSPFFPNDPDLQAEAEQLEPITGVNPFYEGGSSTGVGYTFSGAVEYRVNPYLHVGARVDIERADFYTPNRFAFYFRYSARPHLEPMPLYPKATIPYHQFD